MHKGLMLDLDGVIVDFVRGVLTFHNSGTKYQDIRWNLEKQVRPDLTAPEFWETLGYDFWLSLPFTPFGQALVKNLIRMVGTDNICVCTSPCRTIGSIEAKIEWIRQNLPELQRKFMVTPVKQFAASPDRILIDDNDDNCRKFEEAGGKSVLIPQPWNARIGWLNEDLSFHMGNILEEIEQKLS